MGSAEFFISIPVRLTGKPSDYNKAMYFVCLLHMVPDLIKYCKLKYLMFSFLNIFVSKYVIKNMLLVFS